MSEKRKIIKTESFIRFLSTGRTIEDISNNFGVEITRIRKKLRELEKNSNGFDIFQQRNKHNEKIFLALPEVPKPELKPKVWTFRKHLDKPYLWIKFPDNLNFKKIKIIPLSDIHYGEIGHKSKLFKQYVNWIAKTENVFCFLNGDNIANALKDSPGTAIFSQLMSPSEQRKGIVKALRPIAHKILWSLPGGHEFRSIARVDFDPSEWICRELDIPYFSGPTYVDILWEGYTFTFFCQHGMKTPQTEGGKINKASAPLKVQEFVMFEVTGHFHDATTNKVMRICRERKFDDSGKLTSFKLTTKKQYVIICPSFFGYFGTYAYHSGYTPASSGNVTCELYPNGDYHATR